jgi:hypothetical protein
VLRHKAVDQRHSRGRALDCRDDFDPRLAWEERLERCIG